MIRRRIILALIYVCCWVGCGYSQTPAPSQNAEDLIELLKLSGYQNADKAFEYSVAENIVNSFVRYGSPSEESKWLKADQFDKIDLKKRFSAYAAEMKSKTFVLKKLNGKVLERGNVESEGIYVQIKLPFRLRSSKPFCQDQEGFSGNLRRILVSEINDNRYAFLKKDETLSECTYQEAQVVLKNDGILYHPEVANTNLIININDKFDTLKDIAKSTKSYEFNLEFTNLRIGTPEEWGFYRQKSYKENDMNCEQLQLNNPKTIKIIAPDYFVSHISTHSNAEMRPPEMVMASVISIKIRTPDGTVIGSYTNKNK